MSFARLQNVMKRQALLAVASMAKPRLGIVSSYDPATYAAKVRLMPEDVETGWCPIATIRAGSGAGIYAPPNIDDQVLVLFQESATEAGIIVGALYSDADRPQSVPAGEVLVAHEAGASLRFTADGVITLTAPDKVVIDANLQVTGDITDQTSGGNDVTVKQLRDAYNAAKYQVLAVGQLTATTDHPV